MGSQRVLRYRRLNPCAACRRSVPSQTSHLPRLRTTSPHSRSASRLRLAFRPRLRLRWVVRRMIGVRRFTSSPASRQRRGRRRITHGRILPSDSERVLCQDPAGRYLSHDAEKVGPEPSLVINTTPSPCHRGWLAGNSSCHKVDWTARLLNLMAGQLPHILEHRYVRPVLGEPEAAVRVDLAQAISHRPAVCIPARSSPSARPPIPANNSSTRTCPEVHSIAFRWYSIASRTAGATYSSDFGFPVQSKMPRSTTASGTPATNHCRA